MSYTIKAEQKQFKDLKNYELFSPMDTEILEAIDAGDEEYINENLFLVEFYLKLNKNSAYYIQDDFLANSFKAEIDKFKPSDPIIFWSVDWDLGGVSNG